MPHASPQHSFHAPGDPFLSSARRPPLAASLGRGAPPRALLVGLGAPGEGDGSAGVRVARLVRDAVPPGVEVMECADAARLVDAWQDVPLAIVVDAMSTGAPAGVISRVEVLPGSRPAIAGLRTVTGEPRPCGLQEAIGQGRALGRLPRRLVIIGIESNREGAPERLSEEVGVAVLSAARRVLLELVRERD